MTAQERLDYLLETVSVRNPEGWTIKKVIAAKGPAVAGKLEVSLKVLADNLAPFTHTTLNALSQESGLSIDDEQSQQLIDQIAGFSQTLPEELRWDPDFVAAIKSLGVTQQPRWLVLGYSAEPLLEEMQAELDEQRLVNAKALFSERMTVGGSASAVWAQAWDDAGA